MNSGSANYKPATLQNTFDDEKALTSFKANPRYSLRTRRVIPSDVTLPDIIIPPYVSPCSDESSCKTWMCSNFFDGFVPEASKLANPQTDSRDPVTTFTNSTQQVVNFTFESVGFDAYDLGSKSSLNVTALIDNVNRWSSDSPDSL